MSADISQMKVLMAEDNELNREIVRYLLEEAGAEVTAVRNGAEVVEEFLKNPEGTYDVILMDIMMPMMNGYDAAGMNDYLTKPLDKEKMLAAVGKYKK